jgi:hypothetical protein
MSNNIDYILKEIELGGIDVQQNDCNDYGELIHRKDFKDLVALEIYDVYFWNDRHEFDLELLRELVDAVESFFQDPDTILQIKSGFLQTLPSTIIISIVSSIWSKLRGIRAKQQHDDNTSSWKRIELNIEKIDRELKNHDYILSEDIETIFDSSREEIQPLLKLCGCKCYMDKRKSIWIKPGLSDNRIKQILKMHNMRKR